jgi:hypothetical protein
MSSKSGPQEIGTTLKTCLLIIGISHKNRNSQLLAAHMKLTAAVGCHATQETSHDNSWVFCLVSLQFYVLKFKVSTGPH